MSKCLLRKAALPRRLRPIGLPRKHCLHTSSPAHIDVTISPSDVWDHSTNSNDRRDVVITSKLSELRRILAPERPEPNQVWGHYIDLLNVLGRRRLPLDIHQAVLRNCTPPAQELRVSIARRRPSKRQVAHLHEARFQAIIRNIRMSGYSPELSDYHFILEHFAATGHHIGAMQVLQEITRAGFTKTARTYGLCLQALCHRLALPVLEEMRPKAVAEVTRFCSQLLNEMWKQEVPATSVNVDMALRVLKETSDLETFEQLLKATYGIDMSYPDRPPLEHWQSQSGQITGTPLLLPAPLPFSTAALNTAIDMYGNLGQISKLIQIFEVTTNPLPPRLSSSSPSVRDDDDDDLDFGTADPRVAPYQPPYAKPNTYTFQAILKWVSRSGHHTLARHYLLHAMRYEILSDVQIRKDCARKPRNELRTPTFAVNRTMLVTVFGRANREKKTELMEWLFQKTGQIIKTKKSHIKYYTRKQAEWQAADREADHSQPRSTLFSAFFTSSSASDEDASKTIDPPPMPYFDVDLDSPIPSSPTPPKLFDINVHLAILERELDELEHFHAHMAEILGRTAQRVKERLGRRVWSDKDVYMRDEDTRVSIGREAWVRKVNFMPTKPLLPESDPSAELFKPLRRGAALHLRPGYIAVKRGISTCAFQSLRMPWWPNNRDTPLS
ncbi:hypothetical protein WOLCODRAFT_118907 [Wolfiporia cocos MD-104 SS10]|uniref:Uncharacterized protein n=1 Tax=Wolfiporia cocos (strain MD-104) TaxID=742152 RepID=A0A2H3JUB8_WOLCO|nr:hypothetical protein WOLCODRAFT_118907 [Wolfiporia cocos MD-104 SS10]